MPNYADLNKWRVLRRGRGRAVVSPAGTFWWPGGMITHLLTISAVGVRAHSNTAATFIGWVDGGLWVCVCARAYAVEPKTVSFHFRRRAR